MTSRRFIFGPGVVPSAIVAFIGYRLLRGRPNRVTMEEPPAAEA